MSRSYVEVRSRVLGKLRLGPASRTFHGGDVFAPIAGLLSAGRFGFRAVGDRCADPVRLPGSPFAATAAARVVAVDRFGNLLTNVTAARVASERWHGVRVAGQSIRLVGTYAEGAPGAAVALINSFERLEIATNQGRADNLLRIGVGAPVEPLLQP